MSFRLEDVPSKPPRSVPVIHVDTRIRGRLACGRGSCEAASSASSAALTDEAILATRLLCRSEICAISALALALFCPRAARAQEIPEIDPDQVLDYAWLYSRADDGIVFSDLGAGSQSTNILSVPISFWLKRLPCCGNPVTPEIEGRTVGIRLRLTGVIGFAAFDSIAEFDIRSVDLGAVLPGIELLFRTGERSMLRPYMDVGWGSTSSTSGTLVYGELGVRTEFVWPLRRWELGLEPRLKGGYSFTDIENLDVSHVELSARMDARYPLGFQIGGQTPDVGAYFKPSWYPNDISFPTSSAGQKSIHAQYEVGVTLGFRYLSPMLCGLFRMPRLGVGWRFGDGTSGLTFQIGGDRVVRLPLP